MDSAGFDLGDVFDERGWDDFMITRSHLGLQDYVM